MLLLGSFTSDGRRDRVLDPWVRAGSRMALQRRVIRLGRPPRRWKTPSYASSVKRKITEVHIQGRPLSSKVGMKSRFYGEHGEQCGVEELALQFYAKEGGGWQGVHTESGIWLTVYGVLMWDIIFADVPNVFHNKFQNAPLSNFSLQFEFTNRDGANITANSLHPGLIDTNLFRYNRWMEVLISRIGKYTFKTVTTTPKVSPLSWSVGRSRGDSLTLVEADCKRPTTFKTIPQLIGQSDSNSYMIQT